MSFQDYVRERMLRRRSEELQEQLPDDQLLTFARKARAVESASSTGGGAVPTPVRHNPLRAMGVELPVSNTKATSSVPAVSAGMMGELQSVKALIEERFNTLAWLGNTRQNPLQSNLILKLIRAGFSPALARTLIERLPEGSGPSESLRWLMQVLERNLRTDAAASPIYDVGDVCIDRLYRRGQNHDGGQTGGPVRAQAWPTERRPDYARYVPRWWP